MRDYARLEACLHLDLLGCSNELQQEFVTSDQTVRSARAAALKRSFYKKLAPLGQTKLADQRALEKFLSVNDRLAAFVEPVEVSEFRHSMRSYFKSYVRECLDFEVDGQNFDLSFMRDNFRPGPGASIGADSRNFYTKLFDSPLTATHSYLHALYKAAISGSDTWTNAEKQRYQRFGDRIVDGNRLFFVPKSSDISRTCCTEPAVNMMFQQAMGAFIETRLRRFFGIDLSKQPDVNRRLARIGSFDLGPTLPGYATIDLSSASDSIRWRLCEEILPNNVLGYIRAFRSPVTALPGGKQVTLAMVSTMGNGFTFPLQTLLFSCAVKAVYTLMNIPMFLESRLPNFSVFGDDIIVEPKAYDAVIQLLEDIGFEVNVSKSFNVGPFRESCGYDYFRGENIRGVYIRTLETPGDVYSAFNRLTRWSAVSGILLPSTLALLKSWAPWLPIPFSRADDEGFKVPGRIGPTATCEKLGWTKYRYLSDRNNARSIPVDDRSSKEAGYKDFNPYGWAVAVFGGYASTPDRSIYPEGTKDESRSISGIQIGFRSPIGVPKIRRRRSGLIPYWDYYDGKDGRFPASVFQRWEALVVPWGESPTMKV